MVDERSSRVVNSYETKLALKSRATQRNYKLHIKPFQKEFGRNTTNFIQDDIDAYFAKLHKIDQRKPEAQQESASTKTVRKAAL